MVDFILSRNESHQDMYNFILETDGTDDMSCDECKDSYVNPDLYCIHQCDEDHECDHDGNCVVVDGDTGVGKLRVKFYIFTTI